MTNPPVETNGPVNFDPLESGRYQLQEVIGTGGMATVFRAWDERLQVARAVKVLLPHLARNSTIRRRFETEARTMARLYHPNIVGVHDVGVDGERVYIIMELVAGGCLMDHVTAHGPMPLKMATGSLLALLHALKEAHAKGVIHRDIKPHNIMVDHQGVQKVGDFGIAHVMNEDLSMTKTGSIMGTWGYMAPEQRASARDVDARSDLYSAAATWYTLLTNLLPTDLFAVDLDETIFDGIPPEAHEVMKGATRLKAEDRFDDCDGMIEAVEALLLTLPEDDSDYPAPGSNLDEEALGLGRRGATIVPHSRSSEASPSNQPGMTYAGGELSEDLSASFSSSGSGTLFDADDGVEDTATINRKNRLFFGLGMILALSVGAYMLGILSLGEGQDRAQQEAQAEQLLAQQKAEAEAEAEAEAKAEAEAEAEAEELLAQMYATGNDDVPEGLDGLSVPDLKVATDETAGEALRGDDVAPVEVADVRAVGSKETKDPSAVAVETVEQAPKDSGEASEDSMKTDRKGRHESTSGSTGLEENKPVRGNSRAFMASVPVRGSDDLETLYLTSLENGERIERPFNRVPGGEYRLHYRFFGEDGPVLTAPMRLDVTAGKTPRIRCSAGFGICRVQN
jgi:serine/threonine protein kinase